MKDVLKNLLSRRTALSTLTIFALFGAVYFSPGNIEIFDPLKNAVSDFEFSDVVFSQFRHDAPIDTNIVIVNIGNLRRAQLAEQIRAINAFQPKVIGLDVLFRTEKDPEQDTPLVNALREAKHVVMIARLVGRDEENELLFKSMDVTHPKFFGPNVSFGHNNFPKAKDDNPTPDGTVRTFAPQLSLRDSMTVAAFPLKIVEKVNASAAQRCVRRGNELETINYRGNLNKFIVLDVDQITPENLEIVRGKIVLMGFLGATTEDSRDMTDKFWSPVSKEVGKSLRDMYGVVIHANVVSMALQGDYINEMSDITALILAVILCYINIALFYTFELRVPTFFGAVVKMVQFGEAFGLMIASIVILNSFSYNISIGLMIAIALLSPDLYEIYDSVIRFLKPKLRNAPRPELETVKREEKEFWE